MEKTSIKRRLVGNVVSNKMMKTIVVEVSSIKVHPKYHKRYSISKRYPAHVDTGEYAVGDKVEIEECPPVSKTVNWKVVGKV